MKIILIILLILIVLIISQLNRLIRLISGYDIRFWFRYWFLITYAVMMLIIIIICSARKQIREIHARDFSLPVPLLRPNKHHLLKLYVLLSKYLVVSCILKSISNSLFMVWSTPRHIFKVQFHFIEILFDSIRFFIDCNSAVVK